jgi:hypothetical protein
MTVRTIAGSTEFHRVRKCSAMPPTVTVDLELYPYGSQLHSSALNWLYANGLDAFMVKTGPVFLTETHLTVTLLDSRQRTVAIKATPEDFGLERLKRRNIG